MSNSKTVKVRFAPSPTGYLHIGGARTALFNYLFAKNQGGEFLLRIEDTDEKRSSQAAIDAILEGLDWLELKHDGNYILQSENSKRHQEIAYKLIETGNAYFCYTSTEELAEMRENAEKKGEVFRFRSPWRNKQPSQATSEKPVIRIKSPLEGFTKINDLVQGEITIPNSEIDDLIMLRSDGTATYMLAVVVDDHDMQISHIIRGDDHLTNAFRQKIIYEALNWNVPQFAHIPLIHGSDGAKMSKRHGATSVIDYKKMGYLPEAMRNYLLRLGWSHKDSEIISDKEAINWFNLENVGKSPARFDFAKLDFINKHYIKEKKSEILLEIIDKYFEKKPNDQEKLRLIRAIEYLKIRAENINDLFKISQIYLDNYHDKIDEQSMILLEKNRNLILELRNILEELDQWNHDQIKFSLNDFAAKKLIKIKDFGPLLRILLTYSNSSAGGIFDIIEILGKSEVIRRISVLNN